MKKIFKWFLLVLTGRCDEAVDDGIANFGGQGRNCYGR